MIITILPAYNEEKAISLLLKKIKKALEAISNNYLVLVIDDGSRDETKKIVSSFKENMPLRIIGHEVNKGLGVAIDTGLKEAERIFSSEDIIIIMDADNTHDPLYIKEMVNKINEGNDVVIASRYQPGAKEIGLSFKRRLFSKIINLILKTLLPIGGVRDYTCGYRAYKGRRLKEAFSFYQGKLVEEKGFLCMVEILLKLKKLSSLKITEIPIRLRYDLKEGPSKMKVFHTILQYLFMIAKSILRNKNTDYE